MRLNNGQMMALITLASGLTVTLCFIICITLAFKLRGLKKRFRALAVDVESDISAIQESAESLTARDAEQSRRIAWLETRVRSGKLATKSEDADVSTLATAEPSMTERRHRVIALSRRGYDVNAIATMLNEMPGEVELIIGLSKAA